MHTATHVSLAADTRVASVQLFILEHLHRRIPLRELAQVACLEKHYLATLFKREVGTTIVNWQRSRRIERAVVLLANKSAPVAQVAHAVGYGDATSLGRAFRFFLDASPREVRRKLIEQRTSSLATARGSGGIGVTLRRD